MDGFPSSILARYYSLKLISHYNPHYLLLLFLWRCSFLLGTKVKLWTMKQGKMVKPRDGGGLSSAVVEAHINGWRWQWEAVHTFIIIQRSWWVIWWRCAHSFNYCAALLRYNRADQAWLGALDTNNGHHDQGDLVILIDTTDLFMIATTRVTFLESEVDSARSDNAIWGSSWGQGRKTHLIVEFNEEHRNVLQLEH